MLLNGDCAGAHGIRGERPARDRRIQILNALHVGKHIAIAPAQGVPRRPNKPKGKSNWEKVTRSLNNNRSRLVSP